MNYFSIDHLIIYAFLIITLVVGLWASRGIKDIREYAIANRQFGTGVLTMTILATYITGSKGIGFVGYVFDDGILPIFSIIGCGAVITFLCIARYIAPKMHYFSSCLTLPELMGFFYGPKARFWIGILGTCYSVALVTLQMIWLGHIGVLFNLSSSLSILLGGGFLVLYAARGGMKAVAITDVLQFIAILVFVPLVAYVILHHVGGIRSLFRQVPAEAFDVFNHPSLKDYIVYCIWDLFPAFPLSFPFLQRMLMARNKRQLVNSYHIGLSFLTVFYLLLTLIGLAAIVLSTTTDINMPQRGSDVLVYIVKNYLPKGAQGITGVGFIAGVMSTADSFLHTAGLALVHDVIQPRLKWKIDALKLTKYLTLLLGLIALILALFYKVLPRVQYGGMDLGKGLNFITEIVALIFTIPLVAGIMGLKTDARSFWIASITTVMVFLSCDFLLGNELVIPVAIAANVCGFFGTHYFQNKGFALVNRSTEHQHSHVWHPTKSSAYQRLIRLLPTPKKVLNYSQNKVAKYGADPTLFALFTSLSYMIPIFMHGYVAHNDYHWLLAIRGTGALLCVGLLLKDYWPKWIVVFFPLYYHFSLFYCLPFTASLIFLLEGSSIEWLVNIALVILLLITLVDWGTFVILTLLGAILGITSYIILLGRPVETLNSDTLYTLVYTFTFSTLIGLLFARRKQRSFDTLASQRDNLTINNQEAKYELFEATSEKFQFMTLLKKAGISRLNDVAHLSKQLLKISQQEGHTQDLKKLVQQLTDQLTPMAIRMDRFTHRILGFLQLKKVSTVPIDSFLQTLQKTLKDKGSILKIEVHTQHKALQCDVEKMHKVIVNSVSFIQAMNGTEKLSLLLGIEDTTIGYSVDSVSPDHVKEVAALRFVITTMATLPKIEKLYMSQVGEENMVRPESASALPLLTNERIVKAHYGYSSTTSQGKEFTLNYVIPINLRKVRSQDIDDTQMHNGVGWPHADDIYPGTQKREQTLLKAIRERSKADLTLVKKAILLIKEYHAPVIRESGEPFYLHPVAVAQIVLDYHQDEATLLGALLHDTVEDTALTLEQIEILFNKEVSLIVGGVTHMESNQETLYKVLLSHPENIHKLLSTEDQRVLYVKLADRMHNMRTIQAKSYESQRRTAEETLLFFVTLAKYLGLVEAAEELRRMSFDVLKK